MRVEVVSYVRGGPNLVALDVRPEDRENEQLIERAKWRLLTKLGHIRRDRDFVLVVCDHHEERGRQLVAALGLDVDRMDLHEPAIGLAPAWLVTKVVGTPIPALSGGFFCLLVVSSEATLYTVKDHLGIKLRH